MKIYTLEEQRRRLDNIKFAEDSVKECTKRVRIHDYIPAQVTYNLGSYPAKFSIKPTEYDHELIKSFAEKGVGLIQLHEEWNDALRIMGADKYTSHDPDGMREFIDLCHKYGIKVLPYVSTCFFNAHDKDYTSKFIEYDYKLEQMYLYYSMHSLKSPEWSEYLYNKVARILDEYDVDGLYNDMGHDLVWHYVVQAEEKGLSPDDVEVPYEPCAEDMLARLYSLTHSKGKIMKHHYHRSLRPVVKEKIYDYLWVGEAVVDRSKLKKTLTYDPYMIPCPDYNVLGADEDFEVFFAQFLPMLQFPLRADGRPYDAREKLDVEGVECFDSYVTEHHRKMAKYSEEHPDGPYIYSEWSSIPDDVNYREKWFYYLDLYKPLVEENNLCHLDIKNSTLTKTATSDNVCLSLFTGLDQYICTSNLGKEDETVVFNDKWQDCESGEIMTEVVLKPNKVRFLKKI